MQKNLASNGQPIIALVNEKRDGVSCVIEWKCLGCSKLFKLQSSYDFKSESDGKCKNMKDINVRAVWGSMVTGGGCSSLNELLGTMGVPGLTEQKYCKIEHEIGKWWSEVSEEEMLEKKRDS